MGTNDPGGERYGGDSGGDRYRGGTGPGSPGPSYSGYREGAYGEPVPDSAYQEPTAYHGPSAYQGPTAPYQDPAARYQGPTASYQGPTDHNQGPAGYQGPTAYQDPASQGPYPPAPYAPVPYSGPPGPVPYGGPPGPYGPYPPGRPTNGMAIAAMVLGILWLFWVGSLLALIFGYVSRQQIRERYEDGDGMAIAGIVLGWIGVATFVLFVLLPFVTGIAGGAYS